MEISLDIFSQTLLILRSKQFSWSVTSPIFFTLCCTQGCVLSSRKTVSFEEQILTKNRYPSKFSCQIEAIVIITLKLFFPTCMVLAGNIQTRHAFRAIPHEWKFLMDYNMWYPGQNHFLDSPLPEYFGTSANISDLLSDAYGIWSTFFCMVSVAHWKPCIAKSCLQVIT